jgi:RNA polymerase sigma-70 factor (ECF subfamily)
MQQQPDQQEFLRLIEENKGIIFKICNSYCPDKSEREDLAQEIVYQLWKSGKQFNPSYKFSTWMYRVALNTAISFHRRSKKKMPVLPLGDNLNEIEEFSQVPGETESRLLHLQKFIQLQKELDRAILLLYLDERANTEIAEIVGISATNVSTKLGRLKEKLKQYFLALK